MIFERQILIKLYIKNGTTGCLLQRNQNNSASRDRYLLDCSQNAVSVGDHLANYFPYLAGKVDYAVNEQPNSSNHERNCSNKENNLPGSFYFLLNDAHHLANYANHLTNNRLNGWCIGLYRPNNSLKINKQVIYYP